LISFEWLILILLLIALAYAAWVIKNEKKYFLKNLISYKIGPFYLQTPIWWSIKEQKENQIIFERKDTKYEWMAIFSLIKRSDYNLDNFLIEFVKNKNIIFDPESSDISFKPNIFNLEMIEVGGTATENTIDRIYYDIAMIRSDNEILICESKSSILNGAVEGPYFEEVLKRIRPV
jgi:hypothetical protein